MSADLKMKFEIEPVETRVIRERVAERIEAPDAGGKMRAHLKFTTRERVVEGGFNVYFPAGHSIFVESRDDLVRMGLSGEPTLVDMNTGEEAPINVTLSPKAVVERNTKTRAGR